MQRAMSALAFSLAIFALPTAAAPFVYTCQGYLAAGVQPGSKTLTPPTAQRSSATGRPLSPRPSTRSASSGASR